MAELGVGYISIVPEVSKISPGIQKALDGTQPAAEKSGQGIGNRLSSGIGKVLKTSVVGVGAAAGAGLGAAVTKGIGRLQGIENAESKLRGLGHEAASVDSIMDNALTSVKGTSYGLEDAATIAASAVAAGIPPGKELERTLKLTGDAAAIAGTDLSTMGSIVNKVATSDMMQMDVANQMMDAGIPILQMVAEEMGVTAEEARKMASDGKISFEIFQNALEAGVSGAALEAGNTTQGAFKNMGAAAGRLGATLAGPFYDQATGAFSGVTDALDSMNDRAKPVMEAFGSWLAGTGIPNLKQFGSSVTEAFSEMTKSSKVATLVKATGDAFAGMFEAGKGLAPVVGNIAVSLGEASAALGISGWQLFLTTLEGVSNVAKAVTPPLETISNFMSEHPAIVTAAVGAWTGFKTIPGIVNRLGGGINSVKTATDPAFSSMRDFGSSVSEAYGYARAANPEMSRFGAALTVVGGKGGVASYGLDKFRGGIGSVIDMLGGPWGVAMMGAGAVIAGVSSASNRASDSQEKLAGASRETEKAQAGLQAALAGTTGELGEQGVAAAAALAKAELTKFTAVGEQMEGFISKTHDLSDAFSMSAEELRNHNREMRDTGAAYDVLVDEADRMGLSMEDVNRVVGEGGSEFIILQSRLRGAGDSGNRAADELQKVRDEVQRSIDAARRVSPAFGAAAEAVDTLADSSSSADDKLSALQSMMQLMGLAPKDAAAATMEAAEAIDELAEKAAEAADATKGMGSELIGADGWLEPTSENARELAGELTSMSEELQKVAINGGDTKGTFDQMGPVLDSLAEKYGLTGDQMDELREKYGLMPDTIETLVKLEGAEGAEADMFKVAAAVAASPDEKSIEVQLEDEDSLDRLRSFGFEVQDLKDGNVRVNLEDDLAREKVAWLIENEFPKLDLATPTAQANLRVDELMFKKDYAQYQLDVLDTQRPMPWADMEIGSLHTKQIDALNQVGLLDGQTPTPDAYMNIDQLSAEQQTALAQVFDLAGQKPTPVADLTTDSLHSKKNTAKSATDDLNSQRPEPIADLNNDGVRTGANESKSWIDSIKGKTVSVIFRAVYEGFKSLTGGDDGGYTGGHFDGASFRHRFAGGGQVPRGLGRHGGYRLPKTGPGTDVLDGFTAFNSDMVPSARLDAGEWVINGRSSDKYDRELREINRGTFPKLPGYADGGRAHADEIDSFVRGNSVRGHRASRPLEGSPYVWGGINWGDCSGAMAAIARFAVGLAPFAARFATGNQREALSSMGFTMGKGPEGSLRFGWLNGGLGGGHTSGTLPNGVNVEMGGGRGNGQYGGNAAPAHHPQYTAHAYLPVPTSYAVAGIEGADFNVPSNRTYGADGSDSEGFSEIPASNRRAITGGGATRSTAGTSGSTADKGPTSWSEVVGLAASEFASGQVKDALGVFGIPDSPPALQAYREWEQSQAEMRSMAAEPEVATASPTADTPRSTAASGAHQTPASQPPPNLDMPDSINRTVKIAYDPTGGAKQWTSVVEMALQKLGISSAHVGRTIDQISIESGGDPNAQNNWDSNAAAGDPSIGLLQVIKSTFQAYRAKDLPDDQRHPLANIYAAANYAQSRYESLDSIWPTRNGYATGGWVKGVGNAVADAIPAMVSNGEFVVRGSRAALYGPILEQINGDRPVAPAPKRRRDGDIHIHGADAAEVMRRLAAQQKKESMQFTGG